MGFLERLKQEKGKEDAEYQNKLTKLYAQFEIEDNQKNEQKEIYGFV